VSIILPLNSGHKSQTDSGLRLENWPMISSIKNRGIPPISRNVKYGIKNAPAIKQKEKAAL
jgi:hypothetical protein